LRQVALRPGGPKRRRSRVTDELLLVAALSVR
jgi:hypothetical protein